MIHYKNSARIGFLFVIPLVLFIVIFMVYPVCYNAVISFYRWNGIAKTKTFIGIKNYLKLFKDPVFGITVKNFLLFAFFTVSVQAIIGLLLATMFRIKYTGRDITKAVIFMPAMLSSIIIGTIFYKLLDPNIGYLRGILEVLKIKAPLANPHLAIWVIIFVNIWQWTGYSMTLYYGSIISLPQELFEVAELDGVNKFMLLTKIIIPLVRGTTYNLTIIGVIGALKQYDLVAALTNGGPANATQTFTTYLYRTAFTDYRQGYASAVAMIMFLIALFLTIVQLKMYNSKNS
jgi:raffinose/stachyose/melibiose transport system permease protein